MFQLHIIAVGLLLNPCPVLIDIGSIDDEEETLIGHLIHQQVVHHAPILVAHHAIEDFPYRHIRDIVGKDVIDITLGIRSGNKHLTHVAHVEDATGCAHGPMLVSDIRVLNGHLEAAERRHQCP